jgi:hypothetical protein
MKQLSNLTLENAMLESRMEKLDAAHREHVARLEEALLQAKHVPARAAAPLPLSDDMRSSSDVTKLIALQFEKDAVIDALKKRQEELVAAAAASKEHAAALQRQLHNSTAAADPQNLSRQIEALAAECAAKTRALKDAETRASESRDAEALAKLRVEMLARQAAAAAESSANQVLQLQAAVEREREAADVLAGELCSSYTAIPFSACFCALSITLFILGAAELDELKRGTVVHKPSTSPGIRDLQQQVPKLLRLPSEPNVFHSYPILTRLKHAPSRCRWN